MPSMPSKLGGMAETPDFDQMTVDLATRAGRGDILPHVREALRLVWNARGTADQQALDDEMLRVKSIYGDLEIMDVICVLKALDR